MYYGFSRKNYTTQNNYTMLFVKLLAMEDQTITAGQVIVRGGAGQGIWK
jgi:hypothetical protein